MVELHRGPLRPPRAYPGWFGGSPYDGPLRCCDTRRRHVVGPTTGPRLGLRLPLPPLSRPTHKPATETRVAAPQQPAVPAHEAWARRRPVVHPRDGPSWSSPEGSQCPSKNLLAQQSAVAPPPHPVAPYPSAAAASAAHKQTWKHAADARERATVSLIDQCSTSG